MPHVVISSALALDGDYQVNRNNPIIGYHNIVTAPHLASTTAETGYPVTNLANPSTNLIWKNIDSGSDEYVTVTVADEVDYVAIARHNLFTMGATISLEYETAPSTFAVLVAAFAPTDNKPILMRFPRATHSALRLRIQSATEDVYIGVMYIGRLLTLQRRIYVGHTPANLGRRSNIANAVAENGNFLGRVVLSEVLGTKVDMSNLTPEWYRGQFDPFVTAAKEAPFFFAWRPYDYSDELSFAWMTDSPQPSNQLPNGMMNVSFSFMAIKE